MLAQQQKSPNGNGYIQQLQHEKENLEELLKQYHNKQQEMEEYIQFKESEIQNLVQAKSTGGQPNKTIGEVRKQVDQIIEILSQQPND